MKTKLLLIKKALLVPLFILLIMTMSTIGKAQTVSIFTDQDDYSPGEVVVITGSGWIPGDQIQLTITHIGDFIPDHTHSPWTLIADADGNLYDEWPVYDMELNTTMWLQAQSLSFEEMYAEKTFTDSQINSINPSSGTTGTVFIISGNGFGGGVGISPYAVYFIDNSGTEFGPYPLDYGGTDELTGTIPSLPPGIYDIIIRNDHGNQVGQTLSDGFTFECTPPAAPTDPVDLTGCENGSEQTLTASATVPTGVSIVWYDAETDGNVVDPAKLISTEAASLTLYGEAVDDVTGCTSLTRTALTLTINAAPDAPVSGGDQTECEEASIQKLTATATVSEGFSVVWYDEADAEVTDPSLNTVGEVTYFAKAKNNSTLCLSLTSTPVKLVINAAPDAPVSGGAQTECEEASIQKLTATATVSEGFSVVWYDENDVEVADPTLNAVGEVTYYAKAKNNTTNCFSLTSTAVKLVINAAPDAPVSGGDQEECEEDPIQKLTATATVPDGFSVVWYDETDAEVADPSLNEVGEVTYYAKAKNNTTNCFSLTSTAIKLTIKPTPKITGPEDFTIVYGCEAPELTVEASVDGGGSLSYQWYNDAGKIWGATQSKYQTPHNYNVGTYHYYVIVKASNGCSATSRVASVTITPQTALAVGDIYYTGPIMAWTTSPTSNTATVTLSATIKNGEPCGDIRTALVTFTVNGQRIPSATNLPVNFIDPNYPEKGGTASAIVQLNIANNATSDLFDIGVIISGNYEPGNFTPGEVTIVKPKPGGVIAGGTLLCNGNSTGFVKGIGVSYLNFYVEFAMKGKSATNPKGKVNLLVASRNKPDGTIDNKLHWYSIKSNAIASLNITSPSAIFSGKANIAEIVGGNLVPIEGNCQMVLDLKDVDLTGNINFKDLAGITIQRNGGGIWYSNNWVNTKTVATNICGGDITVTGAPTTAPLTTKSAEITTAIGELSVEPTLKVYPNPFTERLNIEFSSINDAQARLEIYSITGSKLETLFNGPVKAGMLNKTEYLPRLVSSQMLFYHLTLDGKTQVGKIMYNERK